MLHEADLYQDLRDAVRQRCHQFTDMILAFVAEHVLGLPCSFGVGRIA